MSRWSVCWQAVMAEALLWAWSTAVVARADRQTQPGRPASAAGDEQRIAASSTPSRRSFDDRRLLSSA